MSFPFSSEQLDVIETLVGFCEGKGNQRAIVLEGPAGSGKSTVLSAVISGTSKKILLTAPTNKATRVVRRMAEIAEIDAVTRTTFSALGLSLSKDGEIKEVFQREENDALDGIDILVVDEASMVGVSLMEYLSAEAAARNIRVIFVGDRLQIPPIGEEISKVFDLENIITLSVIRRVAQDNPIIQVVNNIRECINLLEYPRFKTAANDGEGVFTVNRPSYLDYMKGGFASATYKNTEDSFKAIAWRNETVNEANKAIRFSLYGSQAKEKFVLGEKVIAGAAVMPPDDNPLMNMMCTDDEGEIHDLSIKEHPLHPGDPIRVWDLTIAFYGGYVQAYVLYDADAGKLDAKLKRMAANCRAGKLNWKVFWDYKESFHDVRPCHCITAHKSQGSTYENAFVDVNDILANRSLYEGLRILYVACSRPSKRLIVRVA